MSPRKKINLNTKNILEKINEKLPTLSKTHHKIAVYILQNYDKVVFFTSNKLARECNVSESSVVRFANVLDYNGYTDLQRDLQNYLKAKITISHRLSSISDSNYNETDILFDVLTKSVDDINWLIKNINEESFVKVVHLLANARNIFLIGSRNSYSALYFFKTSLSWIRDNVFLVNGYEADFDRLSIVNSEDVVLSVSLPRYLKSTIQIHKYAYEQGANTVCVTDTITSPLVKYSSVPLLINNEILSFSDNLIPVMCIMTGILNAVASINQKSTTKKVEKHEEFWKALDLYEVFEKE